jgi:transglutaminase-like putative cysteine protease
MLDLRAKMPSEYLLADSVIDHAHPAVALQAAQLRDGRPDDVTFARAAFEFVRDNIRHSWDAQDMRVTLSASDTLREGVGLCYAKAHLLAGLLRAQGVPTGLCYQRLTDDGQHFDVHGLAAVFLEGAWHRQDPRGNKAEVDAQFSLFDERLAWPVRPELGECDYVEVFESAHPAVVAALTSTDNVLALCGGGLPDTLAGATPAR